MKNITTGTRNADRMNAVIEAYEATREERTIDTVKALAEMLGRDACKESIKHDAEYTKKSLSELPLARVRGEMKAKIKFGKVDYLNQGRKNCPVEVDIELRSRGGDPTFTIDPETKEKTYTGNTTPEYVELSICGTIWNHIKTDCYTGGQCLDTIAEYVKNPLFKELYGYWKKYHLNGMNAGTPEQSKAVEDWQAAGNRYDYTAACEMLKEKGLYEVNFTGAAVGRYYNNEPYRYGSDWIINAIPGDVLLRIEHIITAANEL